MPPQAANINPLKNLDFFYKVPEQLKPEQAYIIFLQNSRWLHFLLQKRSRWSNSITIVELFLFLDNHRPDKCQISIIFYFLVIF